MDYKKKYLKYKKKYIDLKKNIQFGGNKKITETSILKSSWAKETVDFFKNKTIKIYINDEYDNERIIGNKIVKSMTTNEKNQVQNLLMRTTDLSLKQRINLEFVDNYENSSLIITLASFNDLYDLDLYGKYTEINVDGKQYLLIVLNPENIEDNPDVIKQNILHEFGHFLGLKHPFDCSGPCDSKNFNKKFTITDTLMAYDKDENNFIPEFYTDLDKKAIKEIWDDENYE